MAGSQHIDLPRSRKAATELRARFYFTGRACKHGHVAKRYTIGGSCVECSAAWPKNNEARFKVIQLRSRHKHDDRLRSYRQSHKTEAALYQKAYRKKNRKQLNENANRWYWENRKTVSTRNRTIYRDKIRQHSRNRKARKKRAVGRHTAGDIQAIYIAQRGRCACCRKGLRKKYHVDHIVPLSKGGSNDRRNLQLLCISCNLSKNARDPIEFMQERGMLL